MRLRLNLSAQLKSLKGLDFLIMHARQSPARPSYKSRTYRDGLRRRLRKVILG